MEENKIEQRASNRGNSESDNKGYEEFLALLASPSPHKEMPSATPSLASSSTSTVALSDSKQRVPRCVSLARCNVDIDFDPTPTQDDGPYIPPSAQAPDDCNADAGHATSDDGHCESFNHLLMYF